MTDPVAGASITVERAWARLSQRLDRRDVPVSTGFAQLDAALCGGLRPGTLTMVAGCTGTGTTTLTLGIGIQTALAGQTGSSVVALDDHPDELLIRAMCRHGKAPYDDVVRGEIDDAARFRLAEAGSDLARAGLHVTASASREASEVVDAVHAESERGAGLIVVDAVDPDEVDTLRALRRCAAATQSTIVVAARLPVAPWRNPVSDPYWIADLGELGAAASIVDVVILMSRPDRWEMDHPRSGEIDLRLAKNPLGPPAATVAAAQFRWGRIVDMARGY
ncbi:MAG: DnaB-like helicase C-terminal domain-containing protein [Gordonia sp. (in: high G+C Gram-positive bacteria)]